MVKHDFKAALDDLNGQCSSDKTMPAIRAALELAIKAEEYIKTFEIDPPDSDIQLGYVCALEDLLEDQLSERIGSEGKGDLYAD